MKKLLFYLILSLTVVIDILSIIYVFIYLVEMQYLSIEKIFGTIFYIVFCTMVIILTIDVISWVEKQLHD